jgi:glycosyltransferase involved in cell wall biosynthesis
MSEELKVSVIIPAYNVEKFIEETLNSVLSQSYNNLEIIVVDDGSVDNTAKIINKFANRVVYLHQENSGGCSVPRNFGIKKSTGDLICFFDADDIMLSDRIEQQVNFFKKNPDVGCVFSDYKNFDQNGIFPQSHYQTCPRLNSMLKDCKEMIVENACEHLAEENFGNAGCLMIRSDLLAGNFQFDPTLKASEDFHFYYRLARKTKVGVVNRVGMLRRIHGGNLSCDFVKMFTEGIRSYTMLRGSETNYQAKVLLGRCIASYWTSLSRIRANRGEYRQAFFDEFKALSTNPCPGMILNSLRSFARTGAMALGVYKSKDN